MLNGLKCYIAAFLLCRVFNELQLRKKTKGNFFVNFTQRREEIRRINNLFTINLFFRLNLAKSHEFSVFENILLYA